MAGHYERATGAIRYGNSTEFVQRVKRARLRVIYRMLIAGMGRLDQFTLCQQVHRIAHLHHTEVAAAVLDSVVNAVAQQLLGPF